MYVNNEFEAYEQFRELIDREIRKAKAAIANEQEWIDGVDDKDRIEIHSNNIKTMECYIKILKESFKNTIEEDYDETNIHSR